MFGTVYRTVPKKVSYETDGEVEKVVSAMPSAVTTSARARELGLIADAGADQIISEYVKGGWLP